MAPLDLLALPPLDAPVPWGDLQAFDWVRALEPCPQDPIHHAEGNVWIHTRMVLETLWTMPGWCELPDFERHAVYLACLLHDVAKPATTRVEEDGRVTAKGHSRRGEVMFLLPLPGGLLLHRKKHYPKNGWRLLTGGIDLEEQVGDALLREVMEEVGLTLPVRRYVGIIDYTLTDDRAQRYSFVTHIFLMGYSDEPLQPSHDDEISAVKTVSLQGLLNIANDLDTIADADWRSWGAFRAVAHRRVEEWVGVDEIVP